MKVKIFQKKKKIIIVLAIMTLMVGLVFSYKNLMLEKNNKNENTESTSFAYYIDGVSTRSMPSRSDGYVFDEASSNCTNGVIPSWDYSSWTFEGDYTNYNAEDYNRTNCNLYFTKMKTVSTVLGDLQVYTYIPDFTKSACDDATCESHEKGIFETTDDDGTSYYYRGSVENNYVYFANRYWRIIRINGDESIKMIYDGTTAHPNGESSTDRQAGTSLFNSSNDNNMYLGYMYTSGEAHGLGTSSTIKQANDNFYTSVLSSYASYLDMNAGFCGDRSTLNNQSGVGTGTVSTYMKGYLRVSTSTPTLSCENSSDLYTISSSNKGNKALNYAVGLITADEALFSGTGGGVFDGNYNYFKNAPSSYITTGNDFWTMTPIGYYNPFGNVYRISRLFFVNTSGSIDDRDTTSVSALRPVINIRSDVIVSGDGTMQNPYNFSLN